MAANFLRRCREANAALDLTNRTSLIVGGTEGIGFAIADKLKEMGSRTIIAGRSQHRGNEAHHFKRVDLSLTKDLHRFVNEIKNELKGVDDLLLFQTAGGPPNGRIIDTAEGLERHFALQCMGRLMVSHGLAPLLRNGSVVWVAAPCSDRNGIDLEDLECRNVSWLFRLPYQGIRDSAFLDAMAIELAERHKLRISHLYPGIINTRAGANQGLPFPIVALMKIAAPFIATAPIDYADVLANLI